MASTYLYRQVSSSDTNKNKVTISLWFKKCTTGVEETLISGWMSDNNRWKMRFKSDDTLDAEFGYGGTWYSLRTNRKFRDTSGWYNCVLAYDTTQGTASERVKMYINGIQETSFTEEVYPPQNYGIYLVENTAQVGIGRGYYGGSYQSGTNWSGLMSHVYVTDGYTYTASTFGSTDSTTGEWQINTSPSITMGNNGFTVLKDGNTYTDQSANSNDFTLSGTLTKTEDCPSNVFATLNPLNYTSSAITYSNGNTKATYPGAWMASQGTIGALTGKYYWEAKVNSGNNANLFYGISISQIDLDTAPQNKAGVISQHIAGDRYVDTVYTASAAETFSNGNILGVALDLDSATKTVKFYKNGALLTSSSSINLTSTFDNEFIMPFFAGNNSSATSIWETNFGNGYFGTTAVASAGTNASGIGIFEYDVPTGYTALSTKGLNL